MCTLVAVFNPSNDSPFVWVWYDCQTALKVPRDNPLCFKVGGQCPCPVHNPTEYALAGYTAERIGVVSDIAKDAQ